MLRVTAIFPVVCLLLTTPLVPVYGIIDFNLANGDSTITSAPVNGAPWAAVARNQSSSATSTLGSSIYLGNRWMLTADHNIDLFSISNVQFEPGGPTFSVDTNSFTQVSNSGTITGENVDLAVFRLTAYPGITPVQLFDGNNLSLIGQEATVVGWGVGRNDSTSSPGDTTQNWGTVGGTAGKRWGQNSYTGTTVLSSTVGSENYVYRSMIWTLDGDEGVDEAALTDRDSGSAAFIQSGGDWFLSSLNTAVTTGGSSTFSTITGDSNFGVAISTYRDEILAAVPEPQTYGLLLSVLLLAVALFRPRL